MIKKLVVNGCSWTAGNELECDPEFDKFIASLGLRKQNPNDPLDWNLLNDEGIIATSFDRLFDHFNWAGCLKKKLNIPDLVNLATGGGSNARIVRTTIEYIMNTPAEQLKDILVVIGWTVSERDELYVGNSWQRWNSTQPFDVTVDRLIFNDDKLIRHIKKFQEDYIAYVHSDYAAVHRYFQQTYLLGNLLENLKINYFFFNALPAWWAAGELAADIDAKKEFTYFINWQQSNNRILDCRDTMFEFVNREGYPLAPFKHPLTQGHLAWAQYIYQILADKGLI